MKILWFTNTPSLYKKNNLGYNGGGWIESLEKIITNEPTIELAISFFHPDNCWRIKQNKTTYYPIALYNTKLKKLKHHLFYRKYDKIELSYFLNVISDFKPDIIHVFGTEMSFGLLSNHTTIPIVIHIQGILNPCLNAYFAPGSNKMDLIKQYLIKPVKLISALLGMSIFRLNAKREALILKNCKYFIGRTEWDKDIISLFAPAAKYYFCNEALREQFYEEDCCIKQDRDKYIIVTTLSQVPYKGFDLILKTADLLKKFTKLKFEWHVFGITEYDFWENKLEIKSETVNVHLQGIATADTLVKNLKAADIFVHPSYIDNSPNSVCEAQIIGLPVISTYVGGIPSLIENNRTGILVPSNDPYYLASKIIELSNSREKCQMLSNNAKETAKKRHNREEIINDLISIYNRILYDF